MFFEILGLFTASADLATWTGLACLSPEMGESDQPNGPGIDPMG